MSSPLTGYQNDDLRELAETVVQDEAKQLSHRSQGEQRGVRLRSPYNVGPVEAQAELDQDAMQHRTRSISSATPMQRFLMPDSVNNPFPLLARAAMITQDISYASSHSIECRVENTKEAEARWKRAREWTRATGLGAGSANYSRSTGVRQGGYSQNPQTGEEQSATQEHPEEA